ncbi:MAG TPA: hypothetical protein VN203_11295 [Candidatus Acidoferrum sp.]|nr:hypothetical protein [Candidatus Methylomirabilis sp.]HWU38220.1 hypothetical protein [Candidatus Acidoferrum sp.]
MKKLAVHPVCKRLRTKGYYVTGADDVDLVEFSSTASYWCAHTLTVLGPDDILCSPQGCQPGRTCFEVE